MLDHQSFDLFYLGSLTVSVHDTSCRPYLEESFELSGFGKLIRQPQDFNLVRCGSFGAGPDEEHAKKRPHVAITEDQDVSRASQQL